MDQTRIDQLLEKYMMKTASITEQQELLDWYQKQLSQDAIWPAESDAEEELVRDRMLEHIQAATRPHPARRLPHPTAVLYRNKDSKLGAWILVAASLTAIALGLFFYNRMSSPAASQSNMVLENDVPPGGNGATITLSNGQVIKLDGAKASLAVGNGSLKYGDGTALEAKDGAAGSEGQMLTAATTRGQTYQFTLPDGSKVWLNADSKMIFPSRFDDKERKIFLEGEGYFEVAKVMLKDNGTGSHSQKMPFIVVSKGQQVEVLGTHFNINSYANEGPAKTTLLEGKVRVAALGPRQIPSPQSNMIHLLPGQQSMVSGTQMEVHSVNPNDAVAWKNGEFLFNEESLSSIMRQLARWYNVEVDYSTLPDTRYGGSISRNVNLSKVLKMLELTGNVRLKIENNVIKVYK